MDTDCSPKDTVNKAKFCELHPIFCAASPVLTLEACPAARCIFGPLHHSHSGDPFRGAAPPPPGACPQSGPFSKLDAPDGPGWDADGILLGIGAQPSAREFSNSTRAFASFICLYLSDYLVLLLLSSWFDLRLCQAVLSDGY